jgi:alpha-glucosidase (family GH31 glycosyl hydrolase)
MQFSLAPWRALDDEHLQYCMETVSLREKLGPEILKLAENAAVSGEPITRHMAYVFPDAGYERINDQFMLGDEILVTPVVKKGADIREVVFPAGTWQGDDGSIIGGPCIREISAPLSRLPWYRKIR